MIFRLLRHDEFDFLEEMLYESIFVPEGHPPLPYSIIKDPAIAKYIQDWGNSSDDIAIVAEIEDELIGAVWGRKFKQQNAGYGFINENTPEIGIAVKKEYRNMGIGKKLMTEICSIYKSRNIQAISLSVSQGNKAKQFYLQHGFIITNENNDDYIMMKSIG